MLRDAAPDKRSQLVASNAAARITKQNKELRAEVKELKATVAAWNKSDYAFDHRVKKAVTAFCEAFDLYPGFQGV